MTTSGTYSSGFQIDDLLTEAWERLGKSPAILTADVAASARRSLSLMLIDWTNRDVPLWQVETIIAPLLPGEPAYVMPGYISDVLDVYVTGTTGFDRMLSRISRSNYAAIGDKTVEGMPSQMYVDRSVPNIVVTVYPVPDLDYTMTAHVLRQPKDVTGMLQTADAPLLWSEALASGLAAKMAEKFAPTRLAEKVQLAKQAWDAAHGEERERVPLVIRPDLGSWR
jgi:hypothetical protein